MLRYYLLGDDTAAPSGLYARLCHAFLVFIKPRRTNSVSGLFLNRPNFVSGLSNVYCGKTADSIEIPFKTAVLVDRWNHNTPCFRKKHPLILLAIS